ncbi:glycosyltransferase [Paracoccaceae bacterium]|nr:glycosyltransferase [Paracoccaceae bacterium]
MRVKKIFHIQPGTDGGTERFCISLSRGFQEKGIEQFFAIRPRRDWRREIEEIGEVIDGKFLRRTPIGLFDAWRLRSTIKAFNPDVILSWRAPSGRLIPREHRAAKFVRLGDYPFHIRHLSRLDAVICNNPSIERHISVMGYKGPTEVISNFPREIDNKQILRSDFATPDNVFLVCGVGRFLGIKGFDVLIDAVAQIDDSWLWLIGDGPDADKLTTQAKKLGVSERVKFLGWQDNPSQFMSACNAYVLSSRDEALGNTLIDAWRAGVPSVATMTDGPNWYATDGFDVLLVPIDDHISIVRALKRIRDDQHLSENLIANAKVTLEKKFKRTTVINQYLNLFESFIKD